MLRFEGNPDDPLLRAEIAKREKEQQAVEDEATADLRTESPIEPGSSEHTEAPGPEKTAVPKEDAESLERALTKQVCCSAQRHIQRNDHTLRLAFALDYSRSATKCHEPESHSLAAHGLQEKFHYCL